MIALVFTITLSLLLVTIVFSCATLTSNPKL